MCIEQTVFKGLYDYKDLLDTSAVSIKNFYDYEVLMHKVRSTYFKRVEFINTHQFAFGYYNTDEEIAFHNAGVYNFGNDHTPGWDHYYDNIV